MSAATGLWTSLYHPLRAFLFLRGVYLLLACDLWLAMIEHGGRYGIGGFNVAHFAWLDWLLPLPTPTLYVGLLIASGLIALWLAIDPAPRSLRGLLAALYTSAWLVSLHDSYQHHYLLSWLLVWCVAYPSPRAVDLGRPSLVRGWGYAMTAVTCAIVYTFTGISKSERVWRDGHVLRVLTHTKPPGDASPGKFDGARDLLLSTGLDDQTIWQLFALSTIALQWAIAIGYLAAPGRDEVDSVLRRVLTTAALLGSFAFHAVAELFQVFEIGLFSYYMLWIASVVLAPVWLLAPLGRACAWLAGRLGGIIAPEPAGGGRGALVRVVVAAALLAAMGWIIPLPGAVPAACFCAALVLVQAAWWARGGALDAVAALALRTTASAFVLWLALTRTAVPFDYYRRTAGELQRMGQLEQALLMYRLAERYAPSGSSRANKIRALEAQLERARAH